MSESTRALLKRLCLSQRALSEELGVGYDTVRGWAYGRSTPSDENREALQAFARTHAGELLKLAEELEHETD